MNRMQTTIPAPWFKPLELRGERGTLKSITATHVILEAGGRELSIATSAVLSHVAKQ